MYLLFPLINFFHKLKFLNVSLFIIIFTIFLNLIINISSWRQKKKNFVFNCSCCILKETFIICYTFEIYYLNDKIINIYYTKILQYHTIFTANRCCMFAKLFIINYYLTINNNTYHRSARNGSNYIFKI